MVAKPAQNIRSHRLPANLSSVPGAFEELSKRINALLKLGRAGASIEGKNGIQVMLSESNLVITIDPNLLGGAAGAGKTPFRVLQTDEGAAIVAQSYLHKGLSASDAVTITDLTTDFTLSSNTHVWIQVTVDSSLAPTAAARMTGTAFPSLIVTSGTPPAQTQFNVPVGRVVADSAPESPGFDFKITGSDYHFEQMLNAHLLVSNLCHNGTPVIYAFPWSGV